MPLSAREAAVVAVFRTGSRSKLSPVSGLTVSWLGNITHHMLLSSQQHFCHAVEGKNISFCKGSCFCSAFQTGESQWLLFMCLGACDTSQPYKPGLSPAEPVWPSRNLHASEVSTGSFPFDFFLNLPQKKMLPMSKPGLSILIQGLWSFEALQAQ